jgi:hypothetical protein
MVEDFPIATNNKSVGVEHRRIEKAYSRSVTNLHCTAACRPYALQNTLSILLKGYILFGGMFKQLIQLKGTLNDCTVRITKIAAKKLVSAGMTGKLAPRMTTHCTTKLTEMWRPLASAVGVRTVSSLLCVVRQAAQQPFPFVGLWRTTNTHGSISVLLKP